MYKYNLHGHSSGGSACGGSTDEEMIKRHKDVGFTGFALTNHFRHGNSGVDRNLPWEEYVTQYSRYYYDALETAQKLDFDLLFGVEETYDYGKEFLLYGITPETLIAHPELQHFGIEKWSEVSREMGGFIAYAHPFRAASYIPDSTTIPDISFVDGIEIYNMGNPPEINERALETFKDSGKIFIAGGDLHNINFNDSFGIKVNERITTTQQLAKVLKSKQFELYLKK